MNIRQWFFGLPQRDQLALLLLTIAVTLWVLGQLVLGPASAQRAQMARNNDSATQLLARVDAKVTELIALRSEEGAGAAGNLTAVVSRSSEAAGLTIARLQPNSRGEVQVRFEGVDFDALLGWLAQVEGDQQLVVIDASLAQAGRTGGVNATIRLAGGE